MTGEHSLSAFKLTWLSVKDTAQFCGGVIARAWLALLVLHFISEVSDEVFTAASDRVLGSGKEDLAMIALVVFAQLIFSLLWSAVWTLILAVSAIDTLEKRIPRPFTEICSHYLNPVLIESTRSLASIVFRVPLLILPAAIEYIRLLFVPYVVVFDSAYNLGKVDALESSRRLTKGRWILLVAVLVVSLGLPEFVHSFTQSEISPWFWDNPLSFAITAGLTLFINVFAGLFLFALFRRIFMTSLQST
jgi:hypothetical protein